MKAFVVALLILIIFPGIVINVSAHKSETIGDYEIEVGWEIEPAIIDEPNFITIAISKISESQDNADGLTIGSPITGITENLSGYVSLNGEKTFLIISESPDIAGTYVANFLPTESGHPIVNLSGSIFDEEFETSFHPEKIGKQVGAIITETDKKTLKVGLETVPYIIKAGDDAKLKIDFINPETHKIQEHVDYTIEIKNDNNSVFGPLPLTHTSIGKITIPYFFEKEGQYDIFVNVEGILFQPLPTETAEFVLDIGQIHNMHDMEEHIDEIPIVEQVSIPNWIKTNAGWWANDEIEDSDFISGIQYLIINDIITIPQTDVQNNPTSEIPNWIKTNAGWWSDGTIQNSDFVNGIQFLISNGILTV